MLLIFTEWRKARAGWCVMMTMTAVMMKKDSLAWTSLLTSRHETDNSVEKHLMQHKVLAVYCKVFTSLHSQLRVCLFIWQFVKKID